MSTIHNLAAHGEGGLRGIQTNQRDWSPFVAHFTSWSGMAPIRRAIVEGATSSAVVEMLAEADRVSAGVAEKIGASRELRRGLPSDKEGIASCVCFSECSLPGLLGHCERYGRFGWVFRKSTLFDLGARPCAYVAEEAYAELAERGRGRDADDPAGRLFGLANVYRPPGQGRVQDFTHEREWRLFEDLDLEACRPEVVIAPSAYTQAVRGWFPEVAHHVAIDLLHEWGL